MGFLDHVAIGSLTERVDVSRFAESKILVTGASGMIGSYFVNTLQELLRINGLNPANFLLTSKGGDFRNIFNLNEGGFKYYSGDFTDLSLENGFNYIFHFASPASPINYQDMNSIVMANVLPLRKIQESQSEVIEIIFISAGETLGNKLLGDGEASSEPISETRSHYPDAKLQAEKLLQDMATEMICEHRIIKLFHSFGPGVRENDGRSFADFLWAVARGKPPIIHSDGMDTRSFLYLEDVFSSLFIPISGEDSRTYNVGSSAMISITDFAQLIMSVGGVKGSPIFTTLPNEYVQSPFRDIVPNCDWLKSKGWSQIVGLEEAISRTLNSIKYEVLNS
jgi:UDP-glucuronate decarboxylase